MGQRVKLDFGCWFGGGGVMDMRTELPTKALINIADSELDIDSAPYSEVLPVL